MPLPVPEKTNAPDVQFVKQVPETSIWSKVAKFCSPNRSFTDALSSEKPTRPGCTIVNVVAGKVELSYISTLLPLAVEPRGPFDPVKVETRPFVSTAIVPVAVMGLGVAVSPVPAVTLVTPEAPPPPPEPLKIPNELLLICHYFANKIPPPNPTANQNLPCS